MSARPEREAGARWTTFECPHGHRFAILMDSGRDWDTSKPRCPGCGTTTISVVDASLSSGSVPPTDTEMEAGARALAGNNDADWWADALAELKIALIATPDAPRHVATCHRFIARAVLSAAAGARNPEREARASGGEG